MTYEPILYVGNRPRDRRLRAGTCGVNGASELPATLILGGARSGKSGYAQRRAEAAGGRLVFVATAQALDGEMSARIDRHRADRDARWTTVELPIELAAGLVQAAPDAVVLVDCLTLWLTNVMLAGDDVEARTAELADAVRACPATLLLVSNEVGWGVIPDNALARAFVDAAGRLHQRLADVCDEVTLIVAGRAFRLKRET